MRTKTFVGLALLVAIQSLALQVAAEDEPDIDDEPDVEEEIDEEPDAFFEPEVHVVEKDTPYTGECETIEQSPLGDDDVFFQFHQHDARLDPDRLVRAAHKIISTIRSEVVKKVILDYNPQLSHKVGPYPMVTHVTTVSNGVSHEHCYEIMITILDTDECADDAHPDWRHQCDESTTCVNSQGGYYCACNDGEFAFPGSGNGMCKSEVNSLDCCGSDQHCRSDFKCHSDSCALNDCPENSMCMPGVGNSFSCACKEGFRDVGQASNAGYECVLVDHCADNKCASNCDCESVVNATMDGYFCHPKEGDISYYPSTSEWEVQPVYDKYRLDGNHLCVDQDKAPALVIEGDHPMILEQGSRYAEFGVLIVDEDTGDMKRRFTADYYNAPDLMHPSGFTKKCGKNTVSYSIATPWITSQPTLSTAREVEIVDVDECTYTGEDPDFKHTCVGFATCNNQVCGEGVSSGFSCVCLDEGYEDDGNNGCEDKRPPFMECVGSDTNCGFKHLWVMKGAGAVLDEHGTPVVYYDDESNDAAWLEATISRVEIPSLKATDMVPSLNDNEEDQAVDLTEKIRKGVLTSYEEGLWIQPFYVSDENGNEATFNVQFTVTVITADMIAPLLPQVVLGRSSSEGDEDDADTFGDALNNEVAMGDESICDGNGDNQSTPSFWSYFWFLALAYAAHLTLLAVCKVATAIQCLVLPSSMSSQRERFNSGMETLLYVQSFGNLTTSERQAIIDRKWKEVSSF